MPVVVGVVVVGVVVCELVCELVAVVVSHVVSSASTVATSAAHDADGASTPGWAGAIRLSVSVCGFEPTPNAHRDTVLAW